MIVGAALSVAPIFSVASAQGNSQAQTLLEMQALRREISELRDMVERQQYQLRKLQRATGNSQAAAPTPSRNYSTPAPYSQEPRYGQESYTDSAAQGSVLQNNIPEAGQSGESGAYTQSYPPATDTTVRSIPEASTRSGVSNPEGVEERIITAPPVTGPVNDYPPVVDRSVGGSSTAIDGGQISNSKVTDGSQVDAGQWQSTPEVGAYQNRPGQIDPQVERDPIGAKSSTLETESGGVIAVPRPDQERLQGVELPNTQPTTQDQRVATVGSERPSDSQGIQTSLSESDYYGQGFELLKQSEYEQAATLFEQQLKAYPKGELADDAHYWIAEAMHVSRKLDVAKQHLKAIIQDYPQSRRLPDAMLKTAYIEQQQGNEIEARILFQEIVNYHPKSDAAIAAKNRLAASN